MLENKIKKPIFVLAFSIVFTYGNIIAMGATEQRFKMFKPFIGSELNRLNSNAKIAGIEKWPKSNLLRSAPKIDKFLLSNPAMVTRENISFVPDIFIDDTKGVLCVWHWERFIKNPSPPTELPSDAKASLLKHIPENIKNEPNLIQEYLKENFERYKQSKTMILSGQLRLNMCVAPDAQSANEFLILNCSATQLPDGAVLASFSSKNRLEGLGTIAFSRPLMFVRDNIAVIIDARGELASEALPLAKKIDELILKKPVLTANEIQSRRPVISISSNAIRNNSSLSTFPYTLTAPEGQEIVNVKAYINGELASTKDGIISILGKSGKAKVKVKVVAITSELLANVQEKEVNIP
jgi:hypothetical protein